MRSRCIESEAGIALVACLLSVALLLALGGALVVTSSTETAIAANFRASYEARNAAVAVLEVAIGKLSGEPDWSAVLDGTRRSDVVDGLPTGARVLGDGAVIELDEVVNLANCGTVTACEDTEMDRVTAARPWGTNNPRWRLYAYGPLSTLLPTAVDDFHYVLVMVADDQSETDGDPLLDDIAEDGPGHGMVVLRAESFGPRSTHHGVEATVARAADATRLVSWRELTRLDRP